VVDTGKVVRYFFGEVDFDREVPHGFGFARIEGGKRLAILRGYWWQGTFRYGARIELAVNPTDESEKYLKYREGSFFDHITLACYQKNFLIENHQLLNLDEYNSSAYYSVSRYGQDALIDSGTSQKFSKYIPGDYFAIESFHDFCGSCYAENGYRSEGWKETDIFGHLIRCDDCLLR